MYIYPSENGTGSDKCIIHQTACKDDLEESLVSPLSFESWESLLEAAKIRNYVLLLEMA